MTKQLSLYMKTPKNTFDVIFYLDREKDLQLTYLKELQKAFYRLSRFIEDMEKNPPKGVYLLGVDGAHQVYDFKLAKSVSYRLECKQSEKQAVQRVLKDIMGYLLMSEVDNITKAEEGEISGE